MSDDIQKMIDDINDKNFTDANRTFTDLLNDKLADALDQEKVAVASSVYGDDEEEDLDYEGDDLESGDDEQEYEEDIDAALEDEDE